MRILSPASDVSALAPLRNETKQAGSIVNERAEPTSARTPSIATTSAVPTVVLDTDVVSDNMAARLCISFLGHVLFLKNQVPLSVSSFIFPSLRVVTFDGQSNHSASQDADK